jgi:hypothetical protein
LTFLPAGLASTSIPVASRSDGSVSTRLPFPAREQPVEDQHELSLHVGEGFGEDLLHPGVDLADDVEQVSARAADVVELLGEEPVTLLQGGELLQCQRVDPTQQRSDRSAAWRRLSCSSRS